MLQGDTLAPFLFILVIDYILRRALNDEDSYVLRSRQSSRYPAIILPGLAYADDIALLCPNPDAAQRALTRLAEEGRRVGLSISGPKTEVLYICTDTSPPLQLPSGETIRVCQDFRYLGANVLDPDNLFGERRRLAWVAARSLRCIFHSPAKDITKVLIFRCIVETVLMYGLEAIPLTNTREAAMDASHRCLLRYALGIHYPEKIGVEPLYARTGVPPLSTSLRRRRLSLVGHVLREDARLISEVAPRTPLALVLQTPPLEPFRRGMSQLKTLTDTFTEDLQALGLCFDNVHTIQKKQFKRDVLSI